MALDVNRSLKDIFKFKKEIERNVVYVNSAVSQTPADTTEHLITFAQYGKIGDALTISDNKITVGKGVKKISLDVNAQCGTPKTGGTYLYILVKKNGTEIINRRSYVVSGTSGDLSFRGIVEVKEGDALQFYFMTTTASVLRLDRFLVIAEAVEVKFSGGGYCLTRFFRLGGGADVTSKENPERFAVSCKAYTGCQHIIQRLRNFTERTKNLLGRCKKYKKWTVHNTSSNLHLWHWSFEPNLQYIHDNALSIFCRNRRESAIHFGVRLVYRHCIHVKYALGKILSNRLLTKAGWLYG